MFYAASKKKIKQIIQIAIVAAGSTGWALIPPPPIMWQSMSSNGSKVELRSSSEAVITLRRTIPGPKADLATHGYGYILSNPLLLPTGWKSVSFSGRWWQEPAPSTNYPEMTMMILGRYPALIHGKKREGIWLGNYLEVSYDSWYRKLKFRDHGTGLEAKEWKIDRSIPLSPRPFFLKIKHNENKQISWDYYEWIGGKWQHIQHQEYSELFEGTNSGKLYWKLGAWTTWEHPTTVKIHFDRLAFRVYFGKETITKDRNDHNLYPPLEFWNQKQKKRKEHKEDGYWKKSRWKGKLENLERSMLECVLRWIPLMPGATNARYYQVAKGTEIHNNSPLNFLIHASVEEVYEYYRTHPPAGGCWSRTEKPNMITWRRGDSIVNIGITPTGIDTITNIFFHACDIDMRPYECDKDVQQGHKDLALCLRDFTLTTWLERDEAREKALNAVKDSEIHVMSFRSFKTLEEMFRFFREHPPKGAEFFTESQMENGRCKLLSWQKKTPLPYKEIGGVGWSSFDLTLYNVQICREGEELVVDVTCETKHAPKP